jgi:hypothetical protein
MRQKEEEGKVCTVEYKVSAREDQHTVYDDISTHLTEFCSSFQSVWAARDGVRK